MFSTLIGPLPRSDTAADPARTDARARIDTAVELAAIGVELVSDGVTVDVIGAEADGDPHAQARAVSSEWVVVDQASPAPVKQVLLGPWSAARAAGIDPIEAAERLRLVIGALTEVSCPLVEIAEPDALVIADDSAARAAFVEAHHRLLDGIDGIHASLAITGGNVDTAGDATFFDLPYASYAFDLIAGPDNWRLIAHAPGDRGIVCGALDPRPGGEESREVLVWAAHYAASSNGRGLARVGLANASSLEGLARDEALRKVARVVEATRIAAVPSSEEMAGLLDPRAIDPRSAALGRFAPDRRRRV